MEFVSDLYYYYISQETRYQVALFFVVLLLLVSALMVFIVMKERSRKNNRELRENDIKKQTEPLIQEVAFSEQDNEALKEASGKIRKMLKSRFNEISNFFILNDLVIYYHRNLGGESAKRLQELYRQVGIKKKMLGLMKSGEWHERAKAIADLSSMKLSETLYEILQYADSSNKHVRNEAQYAAVKLGGKKALSFLDDLKSPLSHWQQIRLLDQCLKFDFENYESIDKWLQSQNDGVVLFALRLSRHLNQYQESNMIIKLLYHRNVEIQKKAVEACVDLSAIKSLESFYEVYELTKDEGLKQKVIWALGELGSDQEVGFLREIVLKEKHYDLCLEAARSIKRLGRPELLSGAEGLTPQGQSIVKHILDDRI